MNTIEKKEFSPKSPGIFVGRNIIFCWAKETKRTHCLFKERPQLHQIYSMVRATQKINYFQNCSNTLGHFE